MTTTMTPERMMTNGGMTAATQPGVTPPVGWNMVPRCQMQFEACEGGLKVQCKCPDQLACAALQNLCRSLAGGMVTCCCMMNGLVLAECNLFCGQCKCEMTKDGCCVTCTSGDKACAAMLKACCSMLQSCASNGCCCYVMMNGVPVCCSAC